MDVDGLEERLGHRFEDRDHLETALTHRSFAAEEPGVTHNERMEFLGDAVLGLAVTRHLFTRYPDLPEGQLAKARASTVSRPRLAEVATALEVGPLLRLGKGEIATGGRLAGPDVLCRLWIGGLVRTLDVGQSVRDGYLGHEL